MAVLNGIRCALCFSFYNTDITILIYVLPISFTKAVNIVVVAMILQKILVIYPELNGKIAATNVAASGSYTVFC